jgi:uncharacterized protein YfaS (alpha-2-macroglobulin family)
MFCIVIEFFRVNEKYSNFRYFYVSSLGLSVFKFSDRISLSAVDLNTGMPTFGVKLQFFSNKNRELKEYNLKKGYLEIKDKTLLKTLKYVIGIKRENIAFLNIDSYFNNLSQKYKIYLLSDKPIYRPGDKANCELWVKETKTGDSVSNKTVIFQARYGKKMLLRKKIF